MFLIAGSREIKCRTLSFITLLCTNTPVGPRVSCARAAACSLARAVVALTQLVWLTNQKKKLQIQLYFSRIFIRYPVVLQQDIKIMNSLNHRTKFSPQFLKIYLFIFQKNHSRVSWHFSSCRKLRPKIHQLNQSSFQV